MLLQRSFTLFCVLVNVMIAHGKLFDRCEFVDAVVSLRPDIESSELNTWTCIAQQSKFDSSSESGDADAVYHGIFKISDKYWCAKTLLDYYERACHMTCAQLKDDNLLDDIVCAQKIYDEHQRISSNGFSAWPVSQTTCANPSDLVSDCLRGGKSLSTFDNNNVNNVFESNSHTRGYKNNIFVNGKYSAATKSQLKDKHKYEAGTASTLRKQIGKVYERCELAKELRYQHGIELDHIHTWVCIAQHESNFHTSAIGRLNADGSADHGLFQISDLFWCSNDSPGLACQAKCSDFEDSNIENDVRCVKQIFDEHERLFGSGFHAWAVWEPHCKHITKQFTNDCFDGDSEAENLVTPIKTTWKNRPQVPQAPQRKLESGKVYERCELAKELRHQHNLPMEHIHTWVCIAQRESHFHTTAIGRLNADGSADHGLFQISDLFWCSNDSPGLGCQAKCSDFEDSDIENDVRCVKQIFDEHQRLFGNGFHAWAVFEPHCKHITKQFTADCFTDENEIDNEVTPSQISTVSVYASRNVPKGKVYQPCELAKELHTRHNIPRQELPIWVCIAQYESSFDTSAVGRLSGPNTNDNGLFQISDLFWCSNSGAGKACGIACADLLDSDITDDVKCIKQIYEEHQRLSGDGYTAWSVYPRCKGRTDYSDMINQCFQGDLNSVTPSTAFRTAPITSYKSTYFSTAKTSAFSFGQSATYKPPLTTTYHTAPFSYSAPTVSVGRPSSTYSTAYQPSSQYVFNGRTTPSTVTIPKSTYTSAPVVTYKPTYSYTTPKTTASLQASNYVFNGRKTTPIISYPTTTSPFSAYTPRATTSYSIPLQSTTSPYRTSTIQYSTTPKAQQKSSVNAIFDLYLKQWTKSSTNTIGKIAGTPTSAFTTSFRPTTAPMFTTSYSSPYQVGNIRIPTTLRPTTTSLFTPQYYSRSTISTPTYTQSYNSIFPSYSSTQSGQYTTAYRNPVKRTTDQIGSSSSTTAITNTIIQNNKTLNKSGESVAGAKATTIAKPLQISSIAATNAATSTTRTISTTTPSAPVTTRPTTTSPTTTIKPIISTKTTKKNTDFTKKATPLIKNSVISSIQTTKNLTFTQSTQTTPSSKATPEVASAITSSFSRKALTSLTDVPVTRQKVTTATSVPTNPTNTTDNKTSTKNPRERSGRILDPTEINKTISINSTTQTAAGLYQLGPKTTQNSGRYVQPPSTPNAGLYTPFSKDSWEPVKIPGATFIQIPDANNEKLANITKASFTSSQLTPDFGVTGPIQFEFQNRTKI